VTGMPGPAGPETGAGTIHARGRHDQQTVPAGRVPQRSGWYRPAAR
jgi:hypothetical protein